MKILAADIGGTTSRFLAFEAGETDSLTPVSGRVELATAEASSFAELLGRVWPVLGIAPREFAMACLAVAGPIRGGVYCKPPNIAWDIDVSGAMTDLKLARCLLINDFVAQAYACLTEAVSGALLVKVGQADPNGALAVIGAGTGLGHCALLPVDGQMVPVPSEGGHAGFPFVGPEEAAFEAFAREAMDRPYCHGDLIVSGPGLSLLHRFLTGEDLSPEEVAARLTAGAPTQVWFSRFYGRACRDYALTVLSTRGLTIAGGVAARNPLLVQTPHFVEEFVSSPSHADLLGRIPVHLNRNEDSGLFGAAYRGRQALRTCLGAGPA